jgi:protein involved in polysaccharide export with SLBB domain
MRPTRHCFCFQALFGAFGLLLAAHGQNVIPNNSRGDSAPAAVPVAQSAATPANAVGVTVSPGSKLVPGDEVSILIEEDREPAWKTYVTDAGEVELNVLGSVRVAGKTSADAAAAITSYLKSRFYHQATVRFQILKKAAGAVPYYKVMVDGKVGRAGKQPFTDAEPISLSDAITTAGTNIYSDLRRVRLTRGGHTSEHDVEAITKKGRTDLDVRLKDGDRIYVPAKGIVGFGN